MTKNVYQNVLNSLTVKELKQIIRDYMSHLRITMSKKSKQQLIDHIIEHTKINDKGEIKNKVYLVHTIPKKKDSVKSKKVKKPKEEEEDYIKPIKKQNPARALQKKITMEKAKLKEQLVDKVEKNMRLKEKEEENKLEEQYKTRLLETLLIIDNAKFPKELDKLLRNALKELSDSNYDIKYKLQQLKIFNDEIETQKLKLIVKQQQLEKPINKEEKVRENILNVLNVLKEEPQQTEKEIIKESEIYLLNNEIFKIVEDLLKTSSPYKRKEKVKNSYNKIIELVNKYKVLNIKESDLKFLYDYLENYYVQKQSDFYPTPIECLKNDTINKSILQSVDILEPTAGLGHILNYIRKIKSEDDDKYKLTAIEYTEHMAKFLKIFSPDVKVNPDNTNNFLDYNPEEVNHDLIIINPPFTTGNDSRYYLNFLFHCLYLLNRSKVNYFPDLIFISPPIENNEHGGQFLLNDILNYKGFSKKKKEEIYKRYIIKKDDDLDDVFGFLYGEKISSCKGFAGTGFSANIYYIQGTNRSKSQVKKINF